MSSVKLSLVNDFYEREPACTRPKTKKDAEQKQIEQLEGKQQNSNGKSSGRIELELDSTDIAPRVGHFAQIRTDSTKQTATVSLQDCLACSGCVTSAETVLIQQQSTAEFLSHLPTSTSTSTSPSINPSTVIVTISPQSLVSIAAAAGLTPIQTAKRLTTFFHSIGVKYVFDTAFTLDMALIEARAEFLSRLSTTSSPQPLLTSECPGWICFAEKKHGTMIIPYISTVRSPQQIMGAFVKGHFASLHSLPPSSIYHVTIMPCYDKKLEASRDDFYDVENNIRHVDCVLTTGEVQQLIQERQLDLQNMEETALHPDYFNVSPDQQTLYIAPDMGSSGGYAESMARTIATEMQITTPITWQTGMVGRRQQPDLRYTHITGIYNGIQRTVKLATYYGFRHIEKLMKDIKQGKHEYDYVEVMACPSGCLNGGGQIKYEGTTLTTSNIPITTSTTTPPASSTVIPVKSAIEKQKELLTKLEQLYHTRQERPLSSNPVVTRLYRDWIGADPYSSTARQHLHTQYHALDAQEVNPLAIKW